MPSASRQAHLRAGLVPGRRDGDAFGRRALCRGRLPITIPVLACANWASRSSRAACCEGVKGMRSWSSSPGAETCCGFGGTFCIKYPDISVRMAADKAADIAATGAETLLAGDLGCLLNMAGRLGARRQRGEMPPRRRGAGGHDRRGAADRRFRVGRRLSRWTRPRSAPARASRPTAPPPWPIRSCARPSTRRGSASRPIARRPMAGCPSSRRCATRPRRSRTHARPSRLLSRRISRGRSIANGGHVHWARDAAEAREDRPRHLPAAGSANGHQGQVDDLGGDRAQPAPRGQRASCRSRPTWANISSSCATRPPSHIVAPAFHLIREQSRAIPGRAHDLPADRDLAQSPSLSAKAGPCCGEKFLAADVGITGANFLIAETGSSVIVTNEGNGDLTQLLPRTHIVIASIEKVVPTLEDACTLCGCSALGHRPGDRDLHHLLHRPAPRRRSGRPGRISCGAARQRPLGDARHRVPATCSAASAAACINHCPVYAAIGGHAYGLGLSRADGRGADAAA